jgi:hypothetical protein
MDARMQKHRMTLWLGKLLIVLSLVVSCGAQALGWCPTGSPYADAIARLGRSIGPYLTDKAALQAGADAITYGSNGKMTVVSCDGQGVCSICSQNIITGITNCYRALPYFNSLDIQGSAITPCGCPVAFDPAVPYSWNPATGACDSPKKLTITLSGGTEVKPSTLLPFNAVVKDQNGVVQAGIQVSLTVDVQTLGVQSGAIGVLNGEGGHLHTANRPKGKFACSSVWDPGSETATCSLTTDGNGQAPFIFIPTAVSGAHTITATCNNCTTATAPVNVKVDNLITIPASPRYALQDSTGTVVGAIPGRHTANHYLTATAIGRLEVLAALYKTTINPGAKLYLNDASLVWGGLFDVDVNKPWSTPHKLHDTGVSLDIRAANSGPNNEGSVPATLFGSFLDKSRRQGFKIGLHCKNSTDTNYCLGQPNNRHFHVDF